MTRKIDRREVLASVSGLAFLHFTPAYAQGPSRSPAAPPVTPSPAPAAAPRDTNWASYAADNAATRYAPLDQINAGNFNRLEVAWRFKTDNYGPRADSYFNATPLVINKRLYS